MRNEEADVKMDLLPVSYSEFLSGIKERIRAAQVRAVQSANRELVALYWEIGRRVDEKQRAEGWGARVIDRLAVDLKSELPEAQGFSARNIKRMVAFFREYAIVPQPAAQLRMPENREDIIVPQAAAQLAALVLDLPWYHNVVLIERVKDLDARLWYARQTLENGWSRSILELQIQNDAYQRSGRAITNFDRILPPAQSDLARQALKDPYVFDFLTLDTDYRERELEAGLLRHLEKFLLELGAGFAFVGRQYHLEVGGDDFYLDLLFYHLKLRCFVAIDLKIGPFLPEYAGKMNFYLSAVDERLRHADDAASIGLILCQDRNAVIAEYALRGMSQPIGVSEYEPTRALPEGLKSSLPTIEEIEAKLSADLRREKSDGQE